MLLVQVSTFTIICMVLYPAATGCWPCYKLSVFLVTVGVAAGVDSYCDSLTFCHRVLAFSMAVSLASYYRTWCRHFSLRLALLQVYRPVFFDAAGLATSCRPFRGQLAFSLCHRASAIFFDGSWPCYRCRHFSMSVLPSRDRVSTHFSMILQLALLHEGVGISL